MIDEDVAHGLGCDRQEVGPRLPVDAIQLNELEVGLVHERGRVEGVAPALITELAAGDGPQLLVEDRDQLVEDSAIAAFDLEEEIGHSPLGLHPLLSLAGGAPRVSPLAPGRIAAPTGSVANPVTHCKLRRKR